MRYYLTEGWDERYAPGKDEENPNDTEDDEFDIQSEDGMGVGGG